MTNFSIPTAAQPEVVITQVPVLDAGVKVVVVALILGLMYVLAWHREDKRLTEYKRSDGTTLNLVKYARAALFFLVGGLLIYVGLTYAMA
jgi:hypothetical protein